MNVWPLRVQAGNRQAPDRRQVAKPGVDAWALRVLSGTHTGAERRLDAQGMLLIGSSDDCDIILVDAGVGAHHCILSRTEEVLTIRAVDADVRVDERVQHPGDVHPLEAFSTVRIGSASFAIGPHWSERWQGVLQKIDPAALAGTQRRRIGRGKVAALWAAALLLVASGGALVLAQHGAAPPPPKPSAASVESQIKALIARSAPNGLSLEKKKDGSFVVTGYAERAEDIDALKAELERQSLNATIEAKSGARIAGDVGEFFRMNNIHATTEWNGKGRVVVRGRFGDEKDLKAVLASRTMQEFNENLHLKLEVQNTDPPQPEPKPVIDGKRIRRVVDGADAYLVTVDGSRYYRGARLPQGATFVGVENDDVLLRYETDEDVRRISRDNLIDGQFK